VSASLGIAGLASLGVAFAATSLLARYGSRLGFTDIPNERSSHERITPRSGGLGIVVGVATGLVLLLVMGEMPNRQLQVLVSGAGAIVVLGAIDDRHPVRPGYRLVVQAFVATAVAAALGGAGRLPLPHPLDISLGLLSIPFTVVWLVAVTNFYNFMDGIDGLAGGQAVASCIGICVAAWSVGAIQLAVLLGASTVGFLILNRPPARIFLGDAGSTGIGFVIAGLPLMAPAGHRPMALFAVAVGLSLFLLDPLETLVRLARRGHRIGQAHREHNYQLLASNPRRRRLVAGSITATGTLLAVSGGIAYRVPWTSWPVGFLALLAFVAERYLALRSSRQNAGQKNPTQPTGSS